MGLSHAPQAHTGQRDQELVAQLAAQDRGQGRSVAGVHQGQGPAVQALGDADVLLAVADHLHDAALQSLDALAQHLGLAFLQRDGTRAMRVAQLDGGQERRVALEEAGGIDQVVSDVLLGDAFDSHSLISPS